MFTWACHFKFFGIRNKGYGVKNNEKILDEKNAQLWTNNFYKILISSVAISLGKSVLFCLLRLMRLQLYWILIIFRSIKHIRTNDSVQKCEHFNRKFVRFESCDQYCETGTGAARSCIMSLVGVGAASKCVQVWILHCVKYMGAEPE
jgi:hypothetical protein